MDCKTVKELRQLCKTNGIKGYSTWTKQKLIDELNRKLNMDTQTSQSVLYDTFPFDDTDDNNDEIKVVRSNGAWNDMVVDYTIYYDKGQDDLIKYLNDITPNIIDIFQKALERKKSIKVKLVACVQYNEFEINNNETIGKDKRYFHSNPYNILIPNAIEPVITQMKGDVLAKFDSYNAKNTKYKFDLVIRVDIQSDKYNPLRGGTWVK